MGTKSDSFPLDISTLPMYIAAMAFTYDPRLDTLRDIDLIVHDLGWKLEVSESNLDNELQKQVVFAGKLHDGDCRDKTVLVTGHNCCDTNVWINKARKVTEAVIFSYNEVMK
jgi:hypothetical protein